MRMTDRWPHALLGAFLGSLISIGVQWYGTDPINWLFVALGAGVCAVLAFLWDESFLEWLKELWWWT